MEITVRKVIRIEKDTVTYERTDEPWLIIYRMIAQHTEAVGKPPAIGDLVEFETWHDYDGSFNRFRAKV